MGETETSASDAHLVIIIHGIRDFAFWTDDISRSLRKNGLKVARANYEWMNIVQFLLPVPFFRNRARDKVWAQVQDNASEFQNNYPTGKISFVAHSFGSWIVASLLRDNPLLKAHRVIFCGSVVSRGYAIRAIRSRFFPPLLNEVGTADVWPAMADSVTWGYGNVGSYGFNLGLEDEVKDRFHNGLKHSDFLNEAFCDRFWIPFLNGAPPPDGDWPRQKPAWWVRLITRFKIKYALLAIGMAAVAYALLAIFYGPSAYRYGEGGAGLASAPYSGATTTFFPLGATIDRLHKDATEECWMPAGLCEWGWLTKRIAKRRFTDFLRYQSTIETAYACVDWKYPKYGSTTDPFLALADLAATFPNDVAFVDNGADGVELLLTPDAIIKDGHVLLGCSAAQAEHFSSDRLK